MSPRGAEVIVHQAELELGLDAVVGEVEIGHRLDVQAQTVAQWRIRSKGKHGLDTRAGRRAFPEPRWSVSGLPAWYWPEVEEWAMRTNRLAPVADPTPAAPARPGQADAKTFRLIGGILDGQRFADDRAGKPRVSFELTRPPNLEESAAGVTADIPVRSTYQRIGLPDDDGTIAYTHWLTEDLEDA